MEEEVKKSNKKLVWYILFSFVTIILCYLFVVVYFFYISPYNISAKLTLWPFLSESQIGEFYSEASVKVQFAYVDDEFNEAKIDVDGINIDKNGYILFPFSEIEQCTDYNNIKVLTASGTSYNGKFVYGSKDYNLALVKCETIKGKSVKIPYVKIYSSPNYRKSEEVIISKSQIESKRTWSGKIIETENTFLCKTKNDTNEDVFSYSVDGGFLMEVSGYTNFKGGAVLDKSAHLYGFSYKDTLEISSLSGTEKFFVMPAYAISYFLDDAISAYKKGNVYENELATKFVGFDKQEAVYMDELAKTEAGIKKIYFNGDWQTENDAYVNFLTNSIDGYFLFNDFTRGDKFIAKYSVVTSISVNGKRTEVENKVDFLSKIYSAQVGDEVVIYYQRYNGVEYAAASPIQIKL